MCSLLQVVLGVNEVLCSFFNANDIIGVNFISTIVFSQLLNRRLVMTEAASSVYTRTSWLFRNHELNVWSICRGQKKIH